MDEEHTAGYREPCAQCSAVDWGISDEGRFYCRSCHNVIERTREVVDPNFTPGSTRISTISKGSRVKRPERGREWMICEGFQFILRNQAQALLRLGVSTHFKDDVLLPLWRLYLQKTRQAYSSCPERSCSFRLRGPDSDSSTAASASETDGDMNPAGSKEGDSSDWSVCSGSLDAASYLSAGRRRSRGLMSMNKTLALIYLSLVWSRQALTLSDLIRLVKDGHVPYLNAYEDLPEEMKLEGKDSLIFQVQSDPSHRSVHREAQSLILLLQLPAFPPISRRSSLHPALLSLRYLADANLPDQLHPWVCRLLSAAGMADDTLHAVAPSSGSVLPLYDVQAAAAVIVTMKLLFGLDDHTEWELSNEAGERAEPGHLFNLRRWYRLLHTCLMSAQQRTRQDSARKQWKAQKPLYPRRKDKWSTLKKKRISEQLQLCFHHLSSRPASVQRVPPSSFRFCWGDQDGSDGPSLHHQELDHVLTLDHGVLTPSRSSYWHPALRPCDPRKCRSHYSEVEATLPRSFVWLLQLFSFLVEVKPSCLYEEVLKVERRILNTKTQRTPFRTRTSQRIEQRRREAAANR